MTPACLSAAWAAGGTQQAPLKTLPPLPSRALARIAHAHLGDEVLAEGRHYQAWSHLRAWRGNDNSERPGHFVQAASAGVVPTLLADEPEDVEGRFLLVRLLTIQSYLTHISSLPKSISFRLSLRICDAACNLRGSAALKPSYQAANIAGKTCLAEDFLGHPT